MLPLRGAPLSVRGRVVLRAAVEDGELEERAESQEAMMVRLASMGDAAARQEALKEVYHLIHNDAMQVRNPIFQLCLGQIWLTNLEIPGSFSHQN